ncbi:MAG: aminomethyl-transferring glycine dehydrogenase subunit GcvPA [bacterium]|nr:aminomethyl-transferring glycine dehydrogenase subunit GcvPA [bacterium]MBU1918277.1 aminomethyl-transferring glycine dehydrogenase subunit GcvPA [bacterium]
MRYIPHTQDDISEMLKTIGVSSVDELFKSIPEEFHLKENLKLPKGLAEQELRQEIRELADSNISLAEGCNFIGAGAYHHYIPSVIKHLVKRGEFLTAYTPYQAEVSQGTLQAIFEFQTMISELTGMDVSNASNYDLSTACAEALLMAKRINRKNKVLMARSVHPHYRDVVKTYLKHQNYEIIEIPVLRSGQLDHEFLVDHLDDSVSAVLVQSPNFFGVIEDLKPVGDLVREKPALFVVAAAEALSYAVLATPAEVGADIAIGEGMSFGVGLNYGGPYLGLFATKEKYIRNMPGRLVGETVDKDGKRGYVLTFATREQHIRREKATSNICTNQGLCALMSAIYLSLMGREGLSKLALMNMNNIKLLEGQITEKNPNAVLFKSPKFNETVVELSVPAREAVIKLLKDRVLAGIDLSTYYPEFERHLLICTTELNTPMDIEIFVERLRRFL